MSVNSGSLRVAIPSFSPENPDLYFSTLSGIKAAFNLDSKQLFAQVFLTLPREIQIRAQHLLTATDSVPSGANALPETHIDHLVKLRDIIDKHFTLPIEDRIKKVVSGDKTLGDRKPSEYLRHIREIIGSKEVEKYEALVKSAFLDALPEHIAATVKIVAADKNIDEIAVQADRVWPFKKSPTIAQVTVPQEPSVTELESLNQKINALNIQKSMDYTHMFNQLQTQMLQMQEQLAQTDRMVKDLQNSIERMRTTGTEGFGPNTWAPSRPQQAYVPRSFEGSNQSPSDLCYYHQRFGQEAARCSPECRYFRQFRNNQGPKRGNANRLR